MATLRAPTVRRDRRISRNCCGITFAFPARFLAYEKDFGPTAFDEFKKMERFSPDKSWTAVLEEQ
jgi:hypothetical protein